MSVRIRLARGGAKKRPFHQIVVADKRCPRDGRFIESIGFYNPLLPKDHPDALRINIELAKKWIANGAEITERVQKLFATVELFATVGLCEKPAAKTNQTKKHLPKEKAQLRAKEEAERLKAAEEAKAAAEAEAKAAEEAAKAAAEQAQEAPAEQPAEEAAPAEEKPAE